jgi:hypothetical protein
MATQAARFESGARYHALGPDRVDTTFRSRHHRPVSRIQSTDCIDHQYAPTGTKSRTNAIPVVGKTEPGEWRMLVAPQVHAVNAETVNRTAADVKMPAISAHATLINAFRDVRTLSSNARPGRQM